MNYHTSTILQLKDLNLHFEDIPPKEETIKGITSLVFHAKLTYTPTECSCCNAKQEGQIVKNGTRLSRVTLMKVSGLPAYLALRKQRYYCRSCRHSFTASSDIVASHCFISNRLKQAIMVEATQPVSAKMIALMHHVSPPTVHRVIAQAASAIRQRPTSDLPQHLSLDEFKSVKTATGKMSLVCLDNTSHRLVDVLENRQNHSLVSYFTRFSFASRCKVETVSTDLFGPYIDLIPQLFPKAKIVLDRFHIVQGLNRALNQYRVQLMNQQRTHQPKLYRKLKKHWRLLLIHQEKLTSTHYHYSPGFYEWVTTQGIVDYLLEQDQRLKDTYRLVHRLREALQDNDKELFFDCLNAARNLSLPQPLRRFIRTLSRYHQFVENTFDYPTISNGPIEGINNKIKVLKRVAYGFSNFSHFRDRILLMTRLFEPEWSKKDYAMNSIA